MVYPQYQHMKSNLDQLMTEREIDALLVTGGAANNPPMYYMWWI